MEGLTFVSEVKVELVDAMGSDRAIVNAARVSTLGDMAEGADDSRDEGLIRYLMRERHGSPFEHGSMTFRIHVPKYVMIEHLRHRVGWSYNEESTRYREVEPVFYIPARSRVQTGKPGHYVMEPGTEFQDFKMRREIEIANRTSWFAYKGMLAGGVAREVAASVLPLNLMTTAYTTVNPRSMMHFLGLRLPANARQEIRDTADAYRLHFGRLFPLTYRAFADGDFVAP